MTAGPSDGNEAHPEVWWPIETITIATARLSSINENLASLCSEILKRSGVDELPSGVPIATAARMFVDHGSQWAAVVPESLRLQRQRAPRPMPALFGQLRESDPPEFEPLITALYDASQRLAMGVDNPEGRPFRSVCETVLADLETLTDTASAPRTGTFVDKLSVFTLE